MNKKNIIKITLCIIAVIIALLLVHTIRNFVILTNIAKRQENFSNFKNYSLTVEQTVDKDEEDKITKKIYYKDNIYMEKMLINDEPFLTEWKNTETQEWVNLWHTTKQANIGNIIRDKDRGYIYPTSISINDSSLLDKLILSLTNFIITAEVNGEKCYLIGTSYISKETKQEVRRINSQKLIDDKYYDIILEFKDFNTNAPTDEQIAKPSLDGYTVVESNS